MWLASKFGKLKRVMMALAGPCLVAAIEGHGDTRTALLAADGTFGTIDRNEKVRALDVGTVAKTQGPLSVGLMAFFRNEALIIAEWISSCPSTDRRDLTHRCYC